MENDIHKNIDEEIKKIKSFFIQETFIVDNEDYPINGGKLNLSKDTNKTYIDFELTLIEDIHPNLMTFNKLGLNQTFKISSHKEKYIIPAKGTTKIMGNCIVPSNQINGEIKTIYSESFSFNSTSVFRLILNTNDSAITSFFSGSEYFCNSIYHLSGLVKIEIENINYHIYRHFENKKSYLIIECLNETFFESFRLNCEQTLKSIGFLIGNWHQNEHYFFSYNSKNFKTPNSIYYRYFGDSILTNFEVINPYQYINYTNENTNAEAALFPENILSLLINKLRIKPELERTLELIIDGNEITSPLIRCSVFSVALETIISLIHSENKSFFKPLKRENKIVPIIDELLTNIEKFKSKISTKEYEFILKKINYLNTPFNKDKYMLAFELYDIELPDALKKILDSRNLFFHGKTPYKEGLLKTKTEELHLEADRIHMLVSILILKYVNYCGHIKNQAGYRLSKKEDNDENYNDESIFYII